MKDLKIDTSKDPIDFAIAVLKTEAAGLETLNFSELIATDKVAEVCASLDARGIEKITICANKNTSGQMMKDFVVGGFIPTGEILTIEIDGEMVIAFEFEKEPETGGCRENSVSVYKVMGR